MHGIANSLGRAVVALLCMCAAAVAGEPAVSGPNGKFAVEGGGGADDGEGIATGSFALPVGHDFGVQADGVVGSFGDELLGGRALHLFTRDPSRYLFGVYGSYHTWDQINIWRAALEGELYIGRVTLEGLGGYESLDVPSSSTARRSTTIICSAKRMPATTSPTTSRSTLAIATSTSAASAPPAPSI